jgi:hypothetical protein
MSLRSLVIQTAVALAAATPAARAQPVLTMQPAEIHPGTVVRFEISGAEPSARTLVSLSPAMGQTTLGPFRTMCGPVTIVLDLGSPLREVSRGRISEAGTYRVDMAFPSSIPARFANRRIFSQAFTARPIRKTDGTCSWRVQLSNVASAIVRIP